MFDMTGLSCWAICVVIYQIWKNFLIIFDCEIDKSVFLFFLFGMFAKSSLHFEEKWAVQTWENVSFYSTDHGSGNVFINSWPVFLDYNWCVGEFGLTTFSSVLILPLNFYIVPLCLFGPTAILPFTSILLCLLCSQEHPCHQQLW